MTSRRRQVATRNSTRCPRGPDRHFYLEFDEGIELERYLHHRFIQIRAAAKPSPWFLRERSRHHLICFRCPSQVACHHRLRAGRGQPAAQALPAGDQP